MVAIILVILVAIAGTLLVPMLFGYQTYAVLSGSMENEIHVGSIVLVKKAQAADIQEGDVITFHLDEKNIVTHRVVEINEQEKTFTTKGDNNPSVDLETVPFSKLIGKAEHNIPMVGYISIYIKTMPGILTAVGVALVLIILIFLPEVVKKEPKYDPLKEQKKDVVINTNQQEEEDHE